MTPKLNTSQTITVIAAALSLTSACGLGSHYTPPPPPPITAISVHPAHLIFPATVIHTESQPLQVIVTNDYDEPVYISIGENMADQKSFRMGLHRCNQRLDPQESCTIPVIYTPGAVGLTHGRLLVKMSGYSIPVELDGTSVSPPPTTTP